MRKEWTILFVMHALDNILIKEARVLIKLLQNTKWNTEEINVLYLKNTYIEPPAGRRKRKIEARLFHITDKEIPGKFQSVELTNYGQINIGDTVNLEGIFKDVSDKFPSERVMLFTWDHGSGFGVWEADPELLLEREDISLMDLETNIKNANLANKAKFYITNNNIERVIRGKDKPIDKVLENKNIDTTAFGMINFSDESIIENNNNESAVRESTDILTNEELAKAIKIGFKGQKVDLLIMVNCFMQMTETGYSFRNRVDFLVGAETGFWAYGFDYAAIFNKINTKPQTSTRVIADLFIGTIEDAYIRIGEQKLLDSVVVSACDLTYSTQIANYVNKFVELVNSDRDLYYPLIKQARKQTPEISELIFKEVEIFEPYPLFIIDLIYLISLMGVSDNKMKKLSDDFFKNAVNEKYLLSRRVGSDFVLSESRTGKINGFSIYLPQYKKDTQNKDYHEYFYTKNAKFEIEFSKNTLWTEFLSEYLHL